MSDSLTVRKIIDRITSGDIRIPAFQRGYVWRPDQVAFLLDSLYKGFPIGTIFLWKTNERLKSERNLGRFVLPEPKRDYPVNYVLDGQQRLTSLFSVFQTELTPSAKIENEWIDIYYDLKSEESIQDSCFLALQDSEVDLKRHFPVKTMFDSVNYRKATNDLTDDQKQSLDKVQEKFKEVFIPAQIIETDERGKVAIVFERINRAGTDLDTYQLLTAWSWSEDFDLQERFKGLFEEIEQFGFNDLAEDKNLHLKCCSGVVLGEATPGSIMQLRGNDVRENFNKIENGIKSSIDFLKKELLIPCLSTMPYPAMLVPLACFFATDKKGGLSYSDNQRKEILKWFWRSNFSRRYSSSVDNKHRHDLAEFKKLRDNPEYHLKYEAKIELSFFKENQFNAKSVNTKIFILMLAQYNPKSFISGANIDLERVLKQVNRKEFHHIFPKKYLERQGYEKISINMLSNFCFLSNADNQKIKDRSPSDYMRLIAASELKSVMNRALCPENSLELEYNDFIEKRSEILRKKANELMDATIY